MTPLGVAEMPRSRKLRELIVLRKQLKLSSGDVARGAGYNDSYVREIEADAESDEPVGFATRYEIGILKALLGRNNAAREFFGTADFEALLRSIETPSIPKPRASAQD